MLLHLSGLASGEPTADVRTELVRAGPARVGGRCLQVLLEVGLAKPLTGAVGQRRHTVGGQAEQRSDLSRRETLDLGVPEHRLPALRQGGVGAGHDAPLEPRHRGLVGRRRGAEPGLEGLDVVGGRDPPEAVLARHRQSADHREEVGAEGDVRATAVLEHREHLGERLGDHVLGVGDRRGVLSRDDERGPGVTLVERGKGSGLASAHSSDQLGIPEHLATDASVAGHCRCLLRARSRDSSRVSWSPMVPRAGDFRKSGRFSRHSGRAARSHRT